MARRRSKLDTEIQHLYGLPLGEFTAARNALARQLKKGGDKGGKGGKEAADEVASLPKPSVSAWAVNHLFTAAPDRMEELLASGERARKALQEILSGGDPGALRDAIQEARDLANELRDRAVGVLSEDGRRPGQAIVDRIATNLQSLAFSPAAEPQIERGWLDVDLPPPGFEVLAGLQFAAAAPRPAKPAPAAPEPRPRKPAAPAPAARTAADRRRDEQQQEEERLREKREKEEARAQERRDRLEAQRREKLSRAQDARDEAAGRADFLRRKAEQAEKAAEEIRERLEEAERIAEDARDRAKEADKELARADKAVRAARR